MFTSSIGSENREGVVRVVEETDEIVALCLEGDFDLVNAPDLREHVDRVLEGGSNLILDLSNATFVDSSVIHVLVKAAGIARERDRAIVLQLGTAANVERVLELTRIEKVLPRARERREAVRMIHQQAAAR